MLTLKLRTIQRSIVALGFLAFASALAASPAAQATRLLRTPTVSATQIALWYRPHTNLRVWVLDVETGEAKVVGGGPWMVPRLEVGGLRVAPRVALPRHPCHECGHG